MSHLTNLHSHFTKLSLEKHPDKGTCVVARQDIPHSTLLASILAYPITDDLIVMQGLDAHRFVFFQTSLDGKLKNKRIGYLLFDFISWCSHSNHPNIRLEWEQFGEDTIVNVVTDRVIFAGEEITMKYSNLEDYPNSHLWTEKEIPC